MRLVKGFDRTGLIALFSGLAAWAVGLLVVISSPSRKIARHFYYMGVVSLLLTVSVGLGVDSVAPGLLVPLVLVAGLAIGLAPPSGSTSSCVPPSVQAAHQPPLPGARRLLRNRLAVAGRGHPLLLSSSRCSRPLASYDPNAIDLKHVLAPPSGGASLRDGSARAGRALPDDLGGGDLPQGGFRRDRDRHPHRDDSGALWPGIYGRWVDAVIMRFVDIMLCFPTFFLILAVIAILEPSIWNIMIVIGLTGWMGVTRLVRADFISLKERDFVLAARAIGAGDFRIIFLHILPNAMASVLVTATLGVAGAILTESALSFLGIGVQPPTPSWGNILTAGKDNIDYRLVALPLSRAGHPDHRPGLQPAGRGDPRRPRPAPERPVSLVLQFHKYGNVSKERFRKALCPPFFLLRGYPSSAKLVLGRFRTHPGCVASEGDSVRGSPCGEPARLRFTSLRPLLRRLRRTLPLRAPQVVRCGVPGERISYGSGVRLPCCLPDALPYS